MRLLFATRNQGKANEIRQMLNDTTFLCHSGRGEGISSWEVLTVNDVCPDLKIVEDGETFMENAQKKARVVYNATKFWTLSEDSGLEVDALGGKPGLISAGFGGEKATDYERNRRLLEMMIAVPDEQRTARFRCVMCLIDPTGSEKIFEGVCEGKIAHAIRGTLGFGYDPIFIPEGYNQTFAELGQTVKNKISHRAKTFRQVIEHLKLWCEPSAGSKEVMKRERDEDSIPLPG